MPRGVYKRPRKEPKLIGNDTGLYTPERSNRILVAQRLNDVIGMLLDGRGKNEIVTFVRDKYSLSDKAIEAVLIEAHKEINNRKQWELDDLITLHVDRYELIFSKLTELKADNVALDAMKAKEKLLGLHKQGSHVRVVGGQISTVDFVGNKTYYEPSRLSKEQQVRLEELLEKVDSK